MGYVKTKYNNLVELGGAQLGTLLLIFILSFTVYSKPQVEKTRIVSFYTNIMKDNTAAALDLLLKKENQYLPDRIASDERDVSFFIADETTDFNNKNVQKTIKNLYKKYSQSFAVLRLKSSGKMSSVWIGDKVSSETVKDSLKKKVEFLSQNYEEISRDASKLSLLTLYLSSGTVRLFFLGSTPLALGVTSLVFNSMVYTMQTVNNERWDKWIDGVKEKVKESSGYKKLNYFVNNQKQFDTTTPIDWTIAYLNTFSQLSANSLLSGIYTIGMTGLLTSPDKVMNDILIIGINALPITYAGKKIGGFIDKLKVSKNGKFQDAHVDIFKKAFGTGLFAVIWSLNHYNILPMIDAYTYLSSSIVGLLIVGEVKKKIVDYSSYLNEKLKSSNHAIERPQVNIMPNLQQVKGEDKPMSCKVLLGI